MLPITWIIKVLLFYVYYRIILLFIMKKRKIVVTRYYYYGIWEWFTPICVLGFRYENDTTMETPMNTNLKLLSNESSKLVDISQYRHIIGSLMSLTNTRLDICFVVNTLSLYLVKPRWVHLIAAKHVMRHLKGTIDIGIYYGRDHYYRLHGYTNSDWVGSTTDRKRTSSGCYCLWSTMISWFSKKISSVSLITVEQSK